MIKCKDCGKSHSETFPACPFCYTKENKGDEEDYTVPKDELSEFETLSKKLKVEKDELHKKEQELIEKIKSAIVLKNPEMYKLYYDHGGIGSSYSIYYFFTKEEAEKKKESCLSKTAKMTVVQTKNLSIKEITNPGMDHGYMSW